ncbi:hypothetical protein [Limisphaera ngatamarikiensis]|uniref:hypothetical protein n=1 Tax=Limisphaera ngatamarikiensis TaxID=1324935 RepID=UPI00197DC87C|nr:hypothetical protein [Limisphaera ngatamarikiensis]
MSRLSRREFLRDVTAVTAGVWILPKWRAWSGELDRRAIVRRHEPRFTRFDPFGALTVGNGRFAFTADVTGLQTLAEACEKEFPLCTTADWAWHTIPAPSGLDPEKFQYEDFDTYGRKVGYATRAEGQEELFRWLRENPHRFHLGRLAFAAGQPELRHPAPEEIRAVEQHLNLWEGLLTSRFEWRGRTVQVRTGCHPELDLLAVEIESGALADGSLVVVLRFPYGSPSVAMADWSVPDRHTTRVEQQWSGGLRLERVLDETRYHVVWRWEDRAEAQPAGPHEWVLRSRGPVLRFVLGFSPEAFPRRLPRVAEVWSAAARFWNRFWTEGGAVDFDGSTDPRAEELERRVVLSQYNTALHCAGRLPPAETGLLFNSWYGKFHLEMHWWHAVHFVVWNRSELFRRALPFYRRILPEARALARRQGYRGARWPKMVGPEGRDSPSAVGPLLIWQQPHPIYYAELCWRERPTRATLEEWREVVMETAEFMASFAHRDRGTGRYVLGPPLKTVSENTDPRLTRNPTFELTYWRWGLATAQAWRRRLGLAPDPRWEAVLQGLAPLPVADGLYLMQEGMTDTYTRWNWEHPALLGALGMLPGPGVDRETMRRSVRRVMEVWQWDRCWGWDFPLTAMAAARCGEPELAVEALLLPAAKNRYHPNGHNYQRPGLTAYLPGNGGLLAAVAMMTAGWTGAPPQSQPGFPKNGRWKVRGENLRPWL